MKVSRTWQIQPYEPLTLELSRDTGNLSEDAFALGCALALAKEQVLKGEQAAYDSVEVKEKESEPQKETTEDKAEPQEEVEQKVVKKKATRKKAAGKKKVTKKVSAVPKVAKDEIPKEDVDKFQQSFADFVAETVEGSDELDDDAFMALVAKEFYSMAAGMDIEAIGTLSQAEFDELVTIIESEMGGK